MNILNYAESLTSKPLTMGKEVILSEEELLALKELLNKIEL